MMIPKDNETCLEKTSVQILQDVSRKVASLEFSCAKGVTLDFENVSSLSVTTTGDYDLMMVLTVEDSVLTAITQAMKHQENVTAEDCSIYATEFYNIFCGHVISRINHDYHAKARFGIPRLISGSDSQDKPDSVKRKNRLYFTSPRGAAKLEILYI